MSAEIRTSAETQLGVEPPWSQILALAALLPIEAVLLSLRFDTASLGSTANFWAGLLSAAPHATGFCGVIAVTTLLVSGPTLLTEIVIGWPSLCHPGATQRSWLLPLHFTSLLAFVWLTATVLERGGATTDDAGLWMMLWLLSAVATVLLWSLALFPFCLWRQLLARTRAGVVSGIALGGLLWFASLYAERIWARFAAHTLVCVDALLNAFYADVVCKPAESLIGTPGFTVQIAPACSGYEGVALSVFCLSIYLYVNRRTFRFPHALAVIPLGAVLAWAANCVRIAALVAIGSSWSPAIALGGFHSHAGWLSLIAILLGLAAVARRCRFLIVAKSGSVERNAAAAYLAPLLAMLAVSMLISAFTDHSSSLYPFRALVGAGVLWHYRLAYPRSPLGIAGTPIAVGILIFGLWLLLARNAEHSVPEGLARWHAFWGACWWGSRIAGYVVISPLAEELAFRGFLMRRLMAADFEHQCFRRVSPPCLLASSLAFGALHGSNWMPATIAGMAFAFTASWRGRLSDAAVAHITTNALLAVYGSVTTNFSLWS